MAVELVHKSMMTVELMNETKLIVNVHGEWTCLIYFVYFNSVSTIIFRDIFAINVQCKLQLLPGHVCPIWSIWIYFILLASCFKSGAAINYAITSIICPTYMYP